MTTKPSTREEKAEANPLAVSAGTTVKVGYTIATITNISTTKQHIGYIAWGTATGVYTNYQKKQFAQALIDPSNGSTYYQLVYTLTGVQVQGAATTYFANIFYEDGTNAGEVTWSQPSVNPSGTDGVTLANRNLPRMAALAFLASKAASQGWLLPGEWTNFKNGVLSLQTYNKIKWSDGR